jgi:hypothetical protein
VRIRKLDLYELFLPPFLKERVAPKNFNEGKAWVETAHSCKVFAQAFFKKLAVSKGGALVARRNERNFSSALFFLLSFFFCALCVKRKSVVGIEICIFLVKIPLPVLSRKICANY